jgi:hypothetical protein
MEVTQSTLFEDTMQVNSVDRATAQYERGTRATNDTHTKPNQHVAGR